METRSRFRCSAIKKIVLGEQSSLHLICLTLLKEKIEGYYACIIKIIMILMIIRLFGMVFLKIIRF